MKKFSPALLFALTDILLVSQGAHAADIPMGCMPKEKLQALFKENHQSFLEQFIRGTPKGDFKTSVTSKYANGGYITGGIGYIVESREAEACVIAKTRLDQGPGKDEVTVSTLHEFAGHTMTAAEHKKVAGIALKDPAAQRAKWISEGVTEEQADRWLKALKMIVDSPMMPYEESMKLTYRLLPDKAVIVKRSSY